MYKQLNSGQSMSRRVDLQKCQLLKQDTFNYYYLKIVFILLTVTYCYSLLSVGGIITITTNWPFDGTHNLPRNTPSCFLYCAYDNKHVESWIKVSSEHIWGGSGQPRWRKLELLSYMWSLGQIVSCVSELQQLPVSWGSIQIHHSAMTMTVHCHAS